MVKATFSLDDETMDRIRRAAARLGKPQSHVVREAVADYVMRTDRLSERERVHLLGILDGLADAQASRSARGVDAEIRSVREARRVGGRRSA
jgi:predicted transcriptional regulator